MYITASIASPCTSSPVTVSKQVQAGPANNYYIQNIYVYPNPPAVDVYISSSGLLQVVTSWSISVDNGGGTRSDNGYPPAAITVDGGTNCGLHHITLTTYNSCGSYSTTSSFTRSGCFSYALSPNPANSNVIITDTVMIRNPNLLHDKIIISILDQTNHLYKRLSFSRSKQYSFTIADLIPGSYIVQINDGNSITNLKLIKQ